MSALAQERCQACHPGTPPLTAAEIAALRREVPDWEVQEVDGVPRLVRRFSFPDFRHALDFAVRVGELAEAEGHHPLLQIEWGAATVAWWTHAIRGLHRNDFVMAAKTDAAYAAMTGSAEAR